MNTITVHHLSHATQLLPEARVGGHGYSSLLVCVFVCLSVHDSEWAHLAATALRLLHG